MHLRFPVPALALAACLTLPACTLAQGMGSMDMPSGKMDSGKIVAPATVYDHILSNVEGETVGVAEAMPADKFNFTPSASMGKFDGVRSFSSQIKHLTEANYGFFSAWKLPNAKSRADIEKLSSREDLLAALKDSYRFVHSAIATITPQNAFADMDGKGGTRAGAVTFLLVHNNDHYGQMVEYLRMNGAVPPSSMK